MPTFTYFVALGFGITSMLPMSLIYATSGFPMQIGTFNELVYGCESGEETWISDPRLTGRYARSKGRLSTSAGPASLPHLVRKYMV
jgi:hypothetical protein